MGTRSLTFVTQCRREPLVCMYRQMDGYPSGMGRELFDFLKDMVVVNGISGETTGRIANGAGCLAAQLVAHFKTEPGGIYLNSPKGKMECWQEYEYWVDVGTDYQIAVWVYEISGTERLPIFGGRVPEFGIWLDNLGKSE